VENPGVICSPVEGNGIGGLLTASRIVEARAAPGVEAEIVLVALGGGTATGNRLGMRRARMEEMQATMKDTAVAWTCSRVKLPMMMARRMVGSSSSPRLAAVPRRAERFISRLPLRLRIAGMIIMS